MILRPASAHIANMEEAGTHTSVPIWNAIFATQQQAPDWFITQADHAHLAGEIARAIRDPSFPRLGTDVLEAISLHDEGWREFDCGRVRSFITLSPAEFLPAWHGSIAAAQRVSALGAAVVSGHFVRLAKARIQMVKDSPADTDLVNQFLAVEGERRKKLNTVAGQQLEQLIDVLQFCDVFSLYLCCGAWQCVELPQNFGQSRIELHSQGEEYRSNPPLFDGIVSVQVTACRVTGSGPTTLSFQLR